MKYQQAYTTRQTGLGKLIVNKIRSGQSVSGSVGRSVSEKVKSYGTGLMEAFDPLNIAKKLTFGSNLAPAVLGKITGRSADDIRYFSGGKVTKQKGKKIKSGNDYADYIAQPMFDSAIMSKMLTFMKKVDEYKKKQMETAQSFHEEELLERFQRHKEVVEIFLQAINKHRTGEKAVSDSSKKQKKKLLDLPLGKIVLGAGAIAAIAIPSIASAKVGEPVTTEPKEVPQEPGPLDTATKVPDMTTTTKGDVLSGIRSRESAGGDYGAAFGMARGTKIKSVKNLQSPEEFHPKKKRLDEMTLGEVRAYQNYRLKGGDTGSAVGAYQFTRTTLFGDSKSPGLVQKLGMDDNTLFNKDTQDRLAYRLQSDNRSILEKAGVPITAGSEYAAWYVGPGNAIELYRAVQNGEGSSTVSKILDPNGTKGILKNNEELGKITGNEFFPMLQARVEGVKPKVSGEEISNKSAQNASIKKMLKAPDPSRSIMFSQNNNILQQKTITVAPAPEYIPAPIP